MAREFYLMSGSAGHTSSTATPGLPMAAFRPALNTRVGTSSITLVSGNTTGIQATNTAGSTPISWFSPPVQSSFTLSGSVTMSVWGFEAANNNNASVGFRIWHKSASFSGSGVETAIMSTISRSAVEFAANTPNARFITSPIPNTPFQQGDRIVVRLYAINIGTMGTGTATLLYGSPTSGSSGDSLLRTAQDIPLKKKIKSFR